MPLPLIPIVSWAVGGVVSLLVVGAVIKAVVRSFPDLENVVKEYVAKYFAKKAFKWRIEKAKKHSVCVGIYDESENPVKKLNVEFKDVISSDIIKRILKWFFF